MTGTAAGYEVIASPFLDDYLLVRPGCRNGVKIPKPGYAELAKARTCPGWLASAAQGAWGIDLSGRAIAGTVLVRGESALGYGRASYELNLGCNYACEHCYLGLKKFDGLGWPDRERLLEIMRDAGVLWLQLTGGFFRTLRVPETVCLVSLRLDEPGNRCSGCWDVVSGLPRDGACAGARSLRVAL